MGSSSGHFGYAEANATWLWRYHSREGIYRNNIKMEYKWKSYRVHHPRGDSPAYIRLHSKKVGVDGILYSPASVITANTYCVSPYFFIQYRGSLHVYCFNDPRQTRHSSSLRWLRKSLHRQYVSLPCIQQNHILFIHVVLVRGRSWTGGQEERVQVKHEGQSQSICWTGWKATNRTLGWRRQTFDYRSFTLFVVKHVVGVICFFWH